MGDMADYQIEHMNDPWDGIGIDPEEGETETLKAENERLKIWKWSENSNDGSHYNPLLDDICKRTALATGYDWLRLRASLSQAMSEILDA